MQREESEDIRRLQGDLAVMQEVLGTEYPFGWATCVGWLGIAAASAFGAWAAATRSALGTGLTAVSAVVLLCAMMLWTIRARRARAARPAVWREVRQIATAKLLGGPAVLVFILWQLRHGTSATDLIASTAFFAGVIILIYATTRPWRRVGFGLAVPLLGLGAAVPVLGPAHVLTGAALTGVVAGLACAAIVAAHLRAAAS